MSCILWILGRPQGEGVATCTRSLTASLFLPLLSYWKLRKRHSRTVPRDTFWEDVRPFLLKPYVHWYISRPLPRESLSWSLQRLRRWSETTASERTFPFHSLIRYSELRPTIGSGKPASQMKTFKHQWELELDSNLVCLCPKPECFVWFMWGNLLGFSPLSRISCSGKQNLNTHKWYHPGLYPNLSNSLYCLSGAYISSSIMLFLKYNAPSIIPDFLTLWKGATSENNKGSAFIACYVNLLY